MNCIMCGSYAINNNSHGRDGSDTDLCDVCYWRAKADKTFKAEIKSKRSKRKIK